MTWVYALLALATVAIILGVLYRPLGDYMAGSNHVLPTGGTASFASGLNVHAFIKSVQEIEYTKDAMAQMYEPLRALATNEDLPAHAEALAARLTD